MEIGEFQRHIVEIFGEKDRARGLERSFLWFVEEVGELAEAVRRGSPAERSHEVGDCLAWLCSVADQLGVDMADAAARFAGGCPRCGGTPCACIED